MEEKKNNKGLVWLIVILIILVLGLIGYIVYDKVLSKDNELINNESTTTTTTIDNNLNENSNDIINDFDSLPLKNDNTVVKTIKLNDDDFSANNKIIYSSNNFKINNLCSETEDNNKFDCKLELNDKTFYTYNYFKVVDSEPDFYTIYVLNDYIIFTVESGMTILYDFMVINTDGVVLFDSTNGGESKFNVTGIDFYKTNVEDKLPLIIFENKIYFVNNAFYYIDLQNPTEGPKKIKEIEN